jgi:hypothetical protein
MILAMSYLIAHGRAVVVAHERIYRLLSKTYQRTAQACLRPLIALATVMRWRTAP